MSKEDEEFQQRRGREARRASEERHRTEIRKFPLLTSVDFKVRAWI